MGPQRKPLATTQLTMPDGEILSIYDWPAVTPVARGTIIISHGYGEHAGRYQHVADYFSQQGYAVYGADYRGHGINRGKAIGYFESIDQQSDDLAQIIAWARGQQSGPMFLLAHSVGSLIALNLMSRDEERKGQTPIKAMVLSACYVNSSAEYSPALRMVVQGLARFVPHFGVTDRIDSAILSRDSQQTQLYDTDENVFHGKVPAKVALELIDAGDRVRAKLNRVTLPTLILHGADDKLAKPEWSQYVYNHLGSADKSIKFYEGLRHEILNEPEKARVMADIWVWLAAHQGTGELRPTQAAQR